MIGEERLERSMIAANPTLRAQGPIGKSSPARLGSPRHETEIVSNQPAG